MGNNKKVFFSILLSDEGISILTRLLQFLKASFPIISTEDGKLIEVSDEQPEKAYSAIISTDINTNKTSAIRKSPLTNVFK